MKDYDLRTWYRKEILETYKTIRKAYDKTTYKR